MHRADTVAAAAGVNVLCEKRMAFNEADCEAMIEAAKMAFYSTIWLALECFGYFPPSTSSPKIKQVKQQLLKNGDEEDDRVESNTYYRIRSVPSELSFRCASPRQRRTTGQYQDQQP